MTRPVRFLALTLALAALAAPLGAGSALATPGKTCAGFAGLRCDAGETCHITPPVFPDKGGVCERTGPSGPQIMCPHIYQPVCGRNGETYGNRCLAKRAGTSVRRMGACHPRKPVKSDPPAPAPQPKPPASGGAGGMMCPMIYQPVCGKDGKTYPNTCHATRAGVSVAHNGACAAVQ